QTKIAENPVEELKRQKYRFGQEVEPTKIDGMVEARNSGSLVGVEEIDFLRSGKETSRGLAGSVGRDCDFRPEVIGLIAIHSSIERVGEARFDRVLLVWNERGQPVFVGKAEPTAVRAEVKRLVGMQRGVLDLLQRPVDIPDHPFKQDVITGDLRGAGAAD